jgi:hypothetical protein
MQRERKKIEFVAVGWVYVTTNDRGEIENVEDVESVDEVKEVVKVLD